jgi:predicted PP-loop superfamily ATPase
MVVKCEDVWREISNYLEEDLDPALKLAMEEHFAHCTRCESVRDGMRNVIGLYGDKAMFPLPAGFYPRLHDRLADRVEGKRISRRAWLVSVAVTGALAATAVFATALDGFVPQLRSKMSQPARRLPQRLVAIVDGGKKFHVPGCPFMHGKYHMVTAEEAVREGYTPCTRCMSDALRSAGKVTPDFEGEEVVSSETEAK